MHIDTLVKSTVSLFVYKLTGAFNMGKIASYANIATFTLWSLLLKRFYVDATEI